MEPRLRGLAPLPCAVILAIAIALVRAPAPRTPAGTTPDDRGDDRIIGTVGGPLVTTARGHGAPLHADDTTVWLWTDAPIAPGQRVAAIGRLRTPRGSWSPGSPDRSIVIASRGASWELDARELEILGEDDGLSSRTWRWADRTQRTLAARIDASAPAGAALRGIVTGDRSHIPPALDERWRIVGIYHVLSVSGLHLAVIAGLAFALLRRLVAASPWGGRTHPARWAGPVALSLALAYTLVTGAQLATLRALLVVMIVILGQMLDRPVRLLDALGAAAIVLLLWRPADIHDVSFQLSFTAALTLALRPRPAQPSATRRARVAQWFVHGLATSAWVALTTAPITALHVQQVAAGGVVGNLLLTPVIELLALPLGLAGCLLGDLGAPLVSLATALVAIVDGVAGVLARGIPVGTIGVASAPLVAGLVATSLWLAARPRHGRLEAGVWLALCAGWALARTPPPPGSLRVTFLDVGQGDAALVELPGGGVWLVDAGGHAGARDAAAGSAPGRAIARALVVYGRAAIDLAIISHPHPDHYLGLAALDVPIDELWIADDAPDVRATHDAPGAPENGATSFGALADTLARRGTRIVRPSLGALQTPDGVELHVWAPRYRPAEAAPERLAPDPVRTVNDNSLVVTIRYGGRTLLFTGDLELEGEEALVAAGIPAVDVVKVPHHGSRTSSSPAFVAATRPRLAVISCGVANAFGFPAPEVVQRWQAVGATVARTDQDGAIVVTVYPDGELDVARHARPRAR